MTISTSSMRNSPLDLVVDDGGGGHGHGCPWSDHVGLVGQLSFFANAALTEFPSMHMLAIIGSIVHMVIV